MDSNNNPLVIKRRGEDGNKIVSVRMKDEIVDALDKLAGETNRSRNELINMILEYGLKNIKIE